MATGFEEDILVEALKQVRETIGSTKEKEVFKPEYLKRNKQEYFIRRESPSKNVEAV